MEQSLFIEADRSFNFDVKFYENLFEIFPKK